VAPPQQVHALHGLAVHLEPRHARAATARIEGGSCGVAGERTLRSGLCANRGRGCEVGV
jgi:hypothetical protein